MLREHYSRSVLYAAVMLLLVANTVNVGADLGAMVATGQMLVHLPFLVWLAVIVGISLLLQNATTITLIRHHTASPTFCWLTTRYVLGKVISAIPLNTV